MTESNMQSLGPDGDRAPRSTGPRTPGGKRRTKYNATRHGIFADLVLTGEPFRESIQNYKRLLEVLRKAFRLDNALDQMLVEVLAFEFLRLSRIYKADAQIAPRMFERIHTALVEDNPHVITEWVDKEREFAFVQRPLDPELLLRYFSSVTKNIHRSVDQLRNRKS
jgi:hypothetical protein